MSLPACTQTAQIRKRVSQDTRHLPDKYKKGRYSHLNDKTAGDRIDRTSFFQESFRESNHVDKTNIQETNMTMKRHGQRRKKRTVEHKFYINSF